MSKDNLSDEDRALFRQVMKSVKPLKGTGKIDVQPSQPSPIIKKPLQSYPVARASELYLSNYYTNEVQSGTTLSYARQGFPVKRLRDLKQGQIAWEAKLDLHGLKPEAAQESLVTFILQASANNYRSLLIIHGKGSLRGEAPVLKNLVNHWLPQIEQVSAFHSALPKDGGSGALYVLLKRNRQEMV